MPIFQFFLLITPDKITVICSQKKADIIETLKQGDKQITLDVIRRGKVADENVPLYKGVIDQLRNVRLDLSMSSWIEWLILRHNLP